LEFLTFPVHEKILITKGKTDGQNFKIKAAWKFFEQIALQFCVFYFDVNPVV